MSFNKTVLDGKMYDVMSIEQLTTLPQEAYDTRFTAVRVGDEVLPFKASTDTGPGIYSFPNNPISTVVHPSNEEEVEAYSADKIIDFNNVDTIEELMQKQSLCRDLEREILITSGNIFKPVISEEDTPEMAALKEAVCCKNIDIDKYVGKFSSNFSNDKRLFKDTSITLNKMKTIMKALDMKGTLIIEDANPDVPNPIGKKIVVNIIEDGDYDDNSSRTD